METYQGQGGSRGRTYVMRLGVERWAKGKEQEWYLNLQLEPLGRQYWQRMRKHWPEESIREQDQCVLEENEHKGYGRAGWGRQEIDIWKFSVNIWK